MQAGLAKEQEGGGGVVVAASVPKRARPREPGVGASQGLGEPPRHTHTTLLLIARCYSTYIPIPVYRCEDIDMVEKVTVRPMSCC